MEIALFERTLTELDHVRLLNLLRRDAPGVGLHPRYHVIEEMLDASVLMKSRDVPADVVTMSSRVLLQDSRTGRQHALTLCYPPDAEPAVGFVSVLSPIGSALLGLRVGDTARWFTPSGEESAAEVLAILYQPESNGDDAK